MRIRRFALSWKGRPSFNRVEQIRRADIQKDYRRSVLRHTITPVFQAAQNVVPRRVWWNNFQHIMAAVDDLKCRELLG
jgi:hypothetical protein